MLEKGITLGVSVNGSYDGEPGGGAIAIANVVAANLG